MGAEELKRWGRIASVARLLAVEYEALRSAVSRGHVVTSGDGGGDRLVLISSAEEYFAEEHKPGPKPRADTDSEPDQA